MTDKFDPARLRELHEVIVTALDLLDNVTAATDSEADFLGQAENLLRNAAPAILAMAAENAALKADLVEAVARSIAASDGLDFGEICGVDADPDDGYCDSSTCVAAHWEEHDAEQARRWYLHLAQAALNTAAPLIRAQIADNLDAMRRDETNWPQVIARLIREGGV